MTDKELIKNLKALSSVQSDSGWKEANRTILHSQINSGTSSQANAQQDALSFSEHFAILSDFIYQGFIKQTFQPAVASVLGVLVVFAGGIFSLNAARNTTPGDSLYTAKLLGEKTQYALTFDDKAKTKLNIEFAENRAEELAQVMSNNVASGEKQATVEQLTDSFKQEIANVKERIGKINTAKDNKQVAKTPTAKPANDNVENEPLFSANLGKGNQGLDLSDNGDAAPEPVVKEVPAPAALAKPEAEAENTASTSDKAKAIIGTQTILQEAKDFFEKDDYQATIDKLDQVVTHVDKEVANEAAKDNTGQATSTDSEIIK